MTSKVKQKLTNLNVNETTKIAIEKNNSSRTIGKVSLRTCIFDEFQERPFISVVYSFKQITIRDKSERIFLQYHISKKGKRDIASRLPLDTIQGCNHTTVTNLLLPFPHKSIFSKNA